MRQNIITAACTLTLLGCTATNQPVTKEFNTPGAVVVAHTDAETAERKADELLQQFDAALKHCGKTTEMSNWSWDYYAYDKHDLHH